MPTKFCEIMLSSIENFRNNEADYTCFEFFKRKTYKVFKCYKVMLVSLQKCSEYWNLTVSTIYIHHIPINSLNQVII